MRQAAAATAGRRDPGVRTDLAGRTDPALPDCASAPGQTARSETCPVPSLLVAPRASNHDSIASPQGLVRPGAPILWPTLVGWPRSAQGVLRLKSRLLPG